MRRRFDQLLSLSGEATLQEIAAFIEHDVCEVPAFTERQQVRRQILGAELAQAFYADEECQFAALLQGAPAPVATTAIARSQLAPQALARLQREEAAWADWERRLAAARAEWTAAKEWSEPQRRELASRLLARFDASEVRRVKALLRLP